MLSRTDIVSDRPESVEFQPSAKSLRQPEANIDELLTRLYAELQAIEDAIYALEAIAPEKRTNQSRGSSKASRLTARKSKTNKVVDIQEGRTQNVHLIAGALSDLNINLPWISTVSSAERHAVIEQEAPICQIQGGD